MKVVVTGGSGQLGSLVLRRLIDDPSIASIVSIDVRPPLLVSEKLQAVQLDVRDPRVGRHFGGADALVHLAFVVVKHLSPEVAHSINVGGSRNVFDAAARHGVRRIVYSSSIAAYGVVEGHPNPITENTPRILQREFAYAATKFEVEDLLDAFERAHPEISVARLRPSILLGAQMEHALGNLLRHGFLPDTGNAPFPIVWDEDVADATVLALKRAAHGPFNLSAHDNRSSRELAQATGLHVLRSTKQARKAMVQAIEQLARWGLWNGADPAWLSAKAPLYISSERAQRELGWAPRCSTAVSVVERYLASAAQRLDPRIALFFRLLRLMSRRMALAPDERAEVRLVLLGNDGGELGILVEGGHIEVKSEPPRPPTSVVTMPAALLRGLLAGKSELASLRDPRVRVEGDPAAIGLLERIVRTFRDGTNAQGAQRVMARAVSKLLEGSAA